MTEPAIRAVVLDMDGLMLDTEPTSQEGWNRTFHERGIRFRDDQFQELVGLNVADVRRKMVEWYGTDFHFEEIYTRKRFHVDEIIAADGIALKPGVDAFLTAADSLGLAKAVATSTGRERALYKLGRVGLAGRFSVFACGDEIERGKPAPDIFLLAAHRLGIPPAECVALEDSDPGVASAVAAGMRVILIPDVKPPSEEAARLAWHILPDLRAAADLLVKPPAA
jgi:HAD superfamily hydrolase (TIGR01509 family)